MGNNSTLTKENLERIEKLFKNEEDYRKIMQSLRKTRSGLMHIHNQSSHYKDEIFEQMKTLNDLIGVFFVDDMPHPWLEDDFSSPTDSGDPELGTHLIEG
ncbi:hypothetical protein INR75_19665 [Zunongwangia sp. SCSIO 43204]|uniref:hypothetical protein n=1 Tax=Zunongwangia sp. SCSIO 43204 TaxID=2779359 RepID=UPI001CAA0151|nr:hypothetical protein [Zunongwangia sp. SCSIO 43204]UAB84342.1 hypothetical protein INR75_19665 [Zunongwangia sp. SCSIO 43204]